VSHVKRMPPAAPNATPPAQPSPLNVNLYDNLEQLKLAVDQILLLHGRKVPLAELQKWIGKTSVLTHPFDTAGELAPHCF